VLRKICFKNVIKTFPRKTLKLGYWAASDTTPSAEWYFHGKKNELEASVRKT